MRSMHREARLLLSLFTILILSAVTLIALPFETCAESQAESAWGSAASITWYLAEGSTAWGFETYISLMNPNPSEVTAKVTYMPTVGKNVTKNIQLPMLSQIKIENDALVAAMGGQKDFSTKVESTDKTKGIAVDRTMTWTAGAGASGGKGNLKAGTCTAAASVSGQGGSGNPTAQVTYHVTYELVGGHASIDGYLTGMDAHIFWVTDPGYHTASVTDNGVPVTPTPQSAYDLYDVSADHHVVVTTAPDAPTPTPTPAPTLEEGHSSIGVTSPAKTWYLPEGSSKWGFETWLLIQNPNSSKATCNVTYMIEGETPVTKQKTLLANSRQTYSMAADIGEKDASIKVDSNVPIIPERAMYRNNRRGGSDSIGTIAPSTDYYLAEGTTAYGFTTYVLVQNPNDQATDVTFTYMTPGGPKPQVPFSMPPNSRKTIRVNDVLPNTDFSTQVHGSNPIIAERAMYWDNGTGEAFHDSIGMDSPHKTFYFPDGTYDRGRETYTLVQNPNPVPVTVEISYITKTGNIAVVTETIGANSRQTFNMKERTWVVSNAVMVTSKIPGKKIMCERAMYWNSRGAGTDTIGGYSD
jgi:hypothetical protein